jgi:hypothetical protein
MDFLKKLPGLLRQHYEKLVVGLAMAALAVSGLMLARQKQQAEEDLVLYLDIVKGTRPSQYTNMDWTPYLSALQQATNPVEFNLTRPRLHNLFSPVKWQKKHDGTLLKIEIGNEVGPQALKVTKISPLNLIISLDKITSPSNFLVSVTREGHTNARARVKIQSYATLGSKDPLRTFVLKEIKGTTDAPELGLELSDTGGRVFVSKDKPFQRVDGYKVDFSYPPENKAFVEKRLNDMLTLGEQDYNIVVILPNEVVLSARSNNKRTTLRYNAAP